jgi:hypothetical protein
MKQLLDYLSSLGSKHDLVFSDQEILKDSMMGLDSEKKMLLVVSGIKSQPHHYIIDLHEVSSCSVKKYYGRININGLKNRELDQYLEKIILRFQFHSPKQPADILVYKRTDNDVRELPELELKAKKWMELLSKKISKSVRKKNLPLVQNDFQH